jgi:hypothetical protein
MMRLTSPNEIDPPGSGEIEFPLGAKRWFIGLRRRRQRANGRQLRHTDAIR